MSGENVRPPTTVDETATVNETAEAQTAPISSAPSPSVGQQLRAAREAKGLAAVDVARTLKLSLRQIEALEADDWDRLPCTTIIRGFVRNYARLLGLNSEQMMSELDRLRMPQAPELDLPAGTPVKISHETQADRRDYVRVFSGLTVLLLAVLAYFFFPPELWQSTLAALKSATQSRPLVEEKAKIAAPLAEELKSPQTPLVPPATTVLPDASSPPAAPAPSPAPAAPEAPTSQAPVGNVLKFSFAQPSWVEVRDRLGQIIFSQLSPGDSQREIEGQPPFTLVVGNAAHVTLLYKGKSVDLSKRSRDDVARLTVE